MLRLFSASDIHGSNIVFRKFINAGNYYKADALFLVGDITGKALVLVVNKGGVEETYEAEFLGVRQTVRGKTELSALLSKMADRGYYYKVLSEREFETLASDERELRKEMHQEMVTRVEGWMRLATQMLRGTNKRLFMMIGNDDPANIADVIASYSSDNIVNINEMQFELGGGCEGFGLPYSNITPWHLPGDIPEEVLEEKIETLARKLRDPANSIFVTHVPPVNTIIDIAPHLEDLHLKVDMTGVQMSHVGSTAVRAAIERYQPFMSLHGHIHESKGLAKIGRTRCFNAGSEYEQGILKGVIVNVDSNPMNVKSYMFTSG
jgi:Icc-related predicted phosphoesterase